MTKTTLNSLDSSPNPEVGATDSLWQPSWLHWIISALSGTVEIEKQTAWLKKHKQEMRRSNEEWIERQRKIDAEARIKYEQRMKERRQENERLAGLESKLDAVLPKYNFSLTPPTRTDKP
jgi:hypothetical protein